MDSSSADHGKRKRLQSLTQDTLDNPVVNRPRKASEGSPSSHSALNLLRSNMLKSLVIFGDSYSVSSYGEEGKWSDDGEMTWVKDLLPECFHDAETSMKVDHLQARTSLLNISICNLSSLGATAEDDLHNQLGRFFAVFPPKKTPESKPALDPATTCYMLFLGINDCGMTDEDELDEIVEKILDATHRLYIKSGARNFIFIDVPPVDRSPGGLEDYLTLRSRVNTWNSQLNFRVAEFARETPLASVSFFSAHDLFTDILDNPRDYDFDEHDTADEGGAIWTDELHATSAMHSIMANKLLQ